MARKIKHIVIDAEGRDKGKRFLITEMASDIGERWAMQALFLLANNGANIGAVDPKTGMAGLAAVGFQALQHLPYADAEPLMNQMFQCVKIVPSADAPPRPITEGHPDSGEGGDIEEIPTRFTLRKEIFKLHVDFLKAGLLQNGMAVSDPATQAN